MSFVRIAGAALGLAGLVGMGAASPAPAAQAAVTTADFTSRVVVSNLTDPWEITVGPDGYLWTTERSAGRVTRVNPQDGSTHVALVIDAVVSAAADGMLTGNQQGLLGMTLDPYLLRGKGRDYVYLAHSYDSDPTTAIERHTKIVRYTYDTVNQTLGSPVDLLTGLPGGDDHQGGRLTFGPDGKLYYTIGEQGANKSQNFCTPNEAQRLPTAAEVAAKDWSSYKGKVLRINLDGSVPADNPKIHGVRSHVYAYGFRNPQGITFAPDGQLYTSEHGPKTDDELNRIVPGGNYGWPYVAGYRDDKAYVYGNWSAAAAPGCLSLEYSDYDIPASVPQQNETSFNDPAYVEPIYAFGTVDTGYNFQDPASACAPWEIWFICWPSTAPASLDVYRSNAIPGWSGSLLVPSLKDGVVYQVPRTNGGRAAGTPVPFFHTVNRYRDVAVSPDGRTIYVVTDTGGFTHSADGGLTYLVDNPGTILAYTYAPTADAQ